MLMLQQHTYLRGTSMMYKAAYKKESTSGSATNNDLCYLNSLMIIFFIDCVVYKMSMQQMSSPR